MVFYDMHMCTCVYVRRDLLLHFCLKVCFKLCKQFTLSDIQYFRTPSSRSIAQCGQIYGALHFTESMFQHTLVTPAQLMRPGIGRNASCAMSDWLTSRPGGCLQPRELWFTDFLMYMYIWST